MSIREPNVRAEFYGEKSPYGVKISIVGDPNVLVEKVNDAHIARFPQEWEIFSRGAKELDIGGTPLTDVPGITAEFSKSLRIKGVRNAEELAALSDMACSRLGMGIMTHRTNAANMLKVKELEAQPEKRGPGRPRKEPEAA